MNKIKGHNLSIKNCKIFGNLKVVSSRKDMDTVKAGEIVAIPKSLVLGDGLITIYQLISKQVQGVISDVGGDTDHGTVVASEFGISRILVSSQAFGQITKFNHASIAIIGDNILLNQRHIHKSSGQHAEVSYKFIDTKHKVKINLSFPQILHKYPQLIDLADGVGLVRIEFVLLSILQDMHPKVFINKFGKALLIDKLSSALETIIKPFAGKNKEVWLCTNDFTPGDLLQFIGGESEQVERNPALGYRGLVRSLEEGKIMLEPEILAVKKLVEKGYNNLGISAPMSRFLPEIVLWKSKLKSLGLRDIKIGLQVETPSVALSIKEFIPHIDFVSFGSNDLTQFTLALDRTDSRLLPFFNEGNSAVIGLFKKVIEECKESNIETDICGQAGSNWNTLIKLFELGLSSTSVFPRPEIVQEIKQKIKSFENN